MALPSCRVPDPLKTPTGAVESLTEAAAASSVCTSTPVDAGMISVVGMRILLSVECPSARESRHCISITSLLTALVRETHRRW